MSSQSSLVQKEMCLAEGQSRCLKVVTSAILAKNVSKMSQSLKPITFGIFINHREDF